MWHILTWIRTKISWTILKRLTLIAIGFYLLLLMWNYLQLISGVHLKRHTINRSTSLERISTAWLYDKPIAKNIVTNIGDLADNNPTMKVYVYCGTTQCVHEVAALEKRNVAAEFAVISDIVKETPLEKWVAHHPINKLLAGLEFEKHLHEVTILSILWEYGGYYVNPMVRVANGSLPEYQDGTFASILPRRSLLSLFDVSYFSINHPVIEELAVAYTTKYQRLLIEHFPFNFRFLDTVWKAVQRKCFVVPCNGCIHLKNTKWSNGYGILSHSLSATKNDYFSDDLENLASLQYLPFVDTIINRDNLRPLSKMNNVTAFFSGKWKLSGDGDRNSLKSFTPIMLSVDLESDIDWMKSFLKVQAAAIGCRDACTQNFLKADGIKAFSFSSLMLLMNNPNLNFETRNQIYHTELKEEHVHLLPLRIQEKIINLELKVKKNSTLASNYVAAYQLIEKFGSARLVITGNRQLALSCIAIETPVLYVNTGQGDTSVNSLSHVMNMHTMTNDQAREWFEDFSWDDIPQNPNPAMLMRLRATSWNVIRQNQHLYDTAMRFSVVPMSPPLSLEVESTLVFYLVFSTSEKNALSIQDGSHKKQSGIFNWRHWRCVESIFYHHPTAKVNVYSNTLPDNTFDVLVEAGYLIQVQRYSLESMLVGTPAEGFITRLNSARKESFWYTNVSNLLRLLLLYQWGGIYMDTDVIVVKPLEPLQSNSAAWQDGSKAKLNGAFLKFEKGNLFLKSCLEDFVKNYKGTVWGNNGPNLLTRVYHTKGSTWSSDVINVVNFRLFYMINWKTMNRECFNDTKGSTFDANMKVLNTEAFVVHTNSKVSGNKGIAGDSLKNGTICKHLLNSYCVLCDQIY